MKSVPLLLLTLLLTTTPVMAQTAADTGWPVVERCVGEPTAPPEDWTFAGTILMTGYAGIHGVNADWDTPRVVAPQKWYGVDANLPGAALSPDGKWYATPWGDIEITESYNVITNPREIRVYDTFDNTNIYRVDLEDEQYIFGGQYDQIFWKDNEHFLYFKQLINPFTNTIEDAQRVFLCQVDNMMTRRVLTLHQAWSW